jgi:nucleoid-associated protein YgaU
MAFNFLERLGTMFGKSAAERVFGRGSQTAEAPAEAEAAPVEASAEAAPAEAPAAETYATPAEAPAAETYQAPEPVAEAAPAADSSAYTPAPEATAAETSSYAATSSPDTAVAAAPEAPVAEAPAEPAKSAEELAEERLWAETDAAWAAGDFQKVTESLDALKALQPEDAAEIDEKIAAAQYNQASALEQSGELDRALYLYQEAQRRNPNLGEAGFAIERVQAALNPPAPPAEPAPAAEAAPAEQTYTVADGDTLWAIAERHYGDGSQYTRIFEANRDQLDNPDVIQPGQVLRIPA